MDKKQTRAFGKDIYLLGKNEYGEFVWLEAPSWECSWYWGFGYVETYTNNKRPDLAQDISSHSHFDGLVWHKKDNGNYIYHINEIMETPLTDTESWELSDLMKRFYTLKESAEVFHRCTANFTGNTGHDSTNHDMEKYINDVELPKIFARIIEILSPN